MYLAVQSYNFDTSTSHAHTQRKDDLNDLSRKFVFFCVY